MEETYDRSMIPEVPAVLDAVVDERRPRSQGMSVIAATLQGYSSSVRNLHPRWHQSFSGLVALYVFIGRGRDSLAPRCHSAKEPVAPFHT